ncbi:MAG TPA: hypothetical protein VM639_12610 [Dongiaceae bacterium]|nr:hypothetical protein [Dongiaceae bacterium]
MSQQEGEDRQPIAADGAPAADRPPAADISHADENYRQLRRHYDALLAAYDALMKHHGIFLLRQTMSEETQPYGAPRRIGEDQADWISGATYYYAGQLRDLLREIEHHATRMAQLAATAISAPGASTAGNNHPPKAWMLSESEQLLLRARLEVTQLLARVPASPPARSAAQSGTRWSTQLGAAAAAQAPGQPGDSQPKCAAPQ